MISVTTVRTLLPRKTTTAAAAATFAHATVVVSRIAPRSSKYHNNVAIPTLRQHHRRCFVSVPHISASSKTEAGKLIQRRATTGSATSVFYIKNLPGQEKQGKFVEQIFTYMVGGPIAILGAGGMYKVMMD